MATLRLENNFISFAFIRSTTTVFELNNLSVLLDEPDLVPPVHGHVWGVVPGLKKGHCFDKSQKINSRVLASSYRIEPSLLVLEAGAGIVSRIEVSS